MHRLKLLPISIILVILFSLAGPSHDVSAQPLAATSPTLGAAASYSVMGDQTVTNTDLTTMPGDLGVYSGSAVTGFTGTPDGSFSPPGSIHAGDANAGDAQIANSATFDILDQGCTTDYGAVTKDLVSLSLGPGAYCAGAFELSGDLTLTGSGVYIFKSAQTLKTSTRSFIIVSDPCNTWCRVVSSATIGIYTTFIGNILASTSISLQTGASLEGRVLPQTDAVTLDSNTITGENCLAAPAPVPTAQPAQKPGSGSTQETATALAAVPGLPGTGGGAPIRNEDFPWSLVIVGGFSALALVFGVRAFRRTYRSKE